MVGRRNEQSPRVSRCRVGRVAGGRGAVRLIPPRARQRPERCRGWSRRSTTSPIDDSIRAMACRLPELVRGLIDPDPFYSGQMISIVRRIAPDAPTVDALLSLLVERRPRTASCWSRRWGCASTQPGPNASRPRSPRAWTTRTHATPPPTSSIRARRWSVARGPCGRWARPRSPRQPARANTQSARSAACSAATATRWRPRS